MLVILTLTKGIGQVVSASISQGNTCPVVQLEILYIDVTLFSVLITIIQGCNNFNSVLS